MTITKPPPRKFKKILIMEENLKGNTVETVIENIQGEQKAHRKRNPKRKELFRKGNKLREHFSIIHYEGNDFLNLWIDGGHHVSHFTLRLEDIEKLIGILNTSIRILVNNRNTKLNQHKKKNRRKTRI